MNNRKLTPNKNLFALFNQAMSTKMLRMLLVPYVVNNMSQFIKTITCLIYMLFYQIFMVRSRLLPILTLFVAIFLNTNQTMISRAEKVIMF